MTIEVDKLKILSYPHDALRRKARPIPRVDAEVRAVAGRMIELMHEAHGVGLAGPQVGLGWRVFVANPASEPGEDRVYINPQLVEVSAQTQPHEEGCLSLPGITAEVTRPVGVTLRATDEQGEAVEVRAQGMAARVWQHEHDHLEGVLILDRMARIDRLANKRALRELEQAAG